MKIVKTERSTIELNISREELFQKGLEEEFWDTEEEMEEALDSGLSAQGILDTMFDIGHMDDAEVTDLEIVDTKIEW